MNKENEETFILWRKNYYFKLSKIIKTNHIEKYTYIVDFIHMVIKFITIEVNVTIQ